MKTAVCRLAALKAKSFVHGKIPFPKEARVDRRHAYRSRVGGSDPPADRCASPERNSAGVASGRHAVSRFAGDRARTGLFTNGDSDGVGFALCRRLSGIDTARRCHRGVGQAGAGEPGAGGVRPRRLLQRQSRLVPSPIAGGRCWHSNTTPTGNLNSAPVRRTSPAFRSRNGRGCCGRPGRIPGIPTVWIFRPRGIRRCGAKSPISSDRFAVSSVRRAMWP